MLPSGLGSGLRSSSRSSFARLAAVSGLFVTLCAVLTPAVADELADVNKLIRAGQFAEALSKADSFLAKHPQDAQMRFEKGMILTDQKKTAEAIAVFTKLTEDYPTLPEPYNNLAVLFAENGQYDKARLALDNAIRTNPAYATAYENLGDVHARLASQAYDKALQLDSSNSAAKSKLTLLRTMTGVNMGKGQNAAVAATPAAAPAPTPAPVAVTPAPAVKPPVLVAVAAPTPAPAVVKPAAATPAPVPSPTPVAVKPAEVKPEAKVDTKPAVKPAQDSDTEDILNAVHGWAKAWSDQDVKSYLNYYGGDFEPPKGASRKDWAEERHQRIEGKARIEVKVESPQVTINGSTATVKFRQIYTSDRLKADSRKVLVLSKQGGKWQIKQERAGS